MLLLCCFRYYVSSSPSYRRRHLKEYPASCFILGCNRSSSCVHACSSSWSCRIFQVSMLHYGVVAASKAHSFVVAYCHVGVVLCRQVTNVSPGSRTLAFFIVILLGNINRHESLTGSTNFSMSLCYN